MFPSLSEARKKIHSGEILRAAARRKAYTTIHCRPAEGLTNVKNSRSDAMY
jgi:hypothetical protein